MKDENGTSGQGKYAANIRLTIRLTAQEKIRLSEQANIAGLSMSEYIRRNFFGGRLAAHLDVSVIAELRRIGGLLKHNFETLRQAKAPRETLAKQEEALQKLIWTIQKISLHFYDCQKNKEHKD